MAGGLGAAATTRHFAQVTVYCFYELRPPGFLRTPTPRRNNCQNINALLLRFKKQPKSNRMLRFNH